MLNEDKNIGGSLVLDLRIWWRHMKTLYTIKAKLSTEDWSRYLQCNDKRDNT